MSDGLRDALEKLATVLWSDAANNDTDIRHPRVVLENRARDVERILAAHPVEPAPVCVCLEDETGTEISALCTIHNPKPAEPAGVSDEVVEARSHDAAGIPVDTDCPARHSVSGALCIEPPGHEGDHRAMGVSRLQWFGPNLQGSEPTADTVAPHLINTNNVGYFWCSCSPNHARVFRGLREHIAEITSPAPPFMISGESGRHAVWRSIYDAAITAGFQPSQVADKATAAVLALMGGAR